VISAAVYLSEPTSLTKQQHFRDINAGEAMFAGIVLSGTGVFCLS